MCRVLSITILLVLGTLASAHDGDPKLRDRQAPYSGPGYRSGSGTSAAIGGSPITFPADSIALLAWLPLHELSTGLTSGNDCWGYVSASGREYALMGHSGGTTVVEITTPGDPQIIATIDGPTSSWRDIKTYGDHAYAVSEGGAGIQIIDLASVDSGVVTLVGTVTTGGTADTHNVAIDETSGFLYRCGGSSSSGIRIYDLSNPAIPALVGSWNDRYCHDVQVVTYTSGPYAGQQIAFCFSGLNGGWGDPGVEILDVTDKNNIVSLSQIFYTDAVYCHQGWLSPDYQTLYINDELDEQSLGLPTSTRVVDVSDLANPIVTGSFGSGSTSIDHNLYTVGDLIYEANYRSGLRVFDATDPLNPVETAYFDTYPADDSANFNGLWSVYPYFPSGTIIGSDIEKGFFVWKLGTPPFAFDIAGGAPSLLDPTGTPIAVQIVEVGASPLLPGSVTLHLSTDTGPIDVPFVESGVMTFVGDFPALPCGSILSYTVSATSLDGWVQHDVSPATPHDALVAVTQTVTRDDSESSLDWTAGAAGDSATTGLWSFGDPIGTAAQPEDDHTASGTLCWYTGAGAVGGSIGSDDVDDGITTLLSPVFDVSAGLTEISYWRWYSNNEGVTDDEFLVEISGDGGPWLTVEIIGVGHPEAAGGWFPHNFVTEAIIPGASTAQMRFVASDLDAPSLVEAAIDDFRIAVLECNDCDGDGIDDSLAILTGAVPDCNNNSVPDSCDIADGTAPDADGDGIPDSCACPIQFVRGDANGDLIVDVSDAVYSLDYMFSSGPTPVPLESADLNVDGSVNIADTVFLLAYLFQAGLDPAAPFPAPGCP